MLGRSTLAAMAMLGAFSGPTLAVQNTHPPARSMFNDPEPTSAGRRGAGITMAQQKRASKKARNVKRHKKHA